MKTLTLTFSIASDVHIKEDVLILSSKGNQLLVYVPIFSAIHDHCILTIQFSKRNARYSIVNKRYSPTVKLTKKQRISINKLNKTNFNNRFGLS